MQATNGREIMGKPMMVAISNPPAFTPKPKPDGVKFATSSDAFLQPNVTAPLNGLVFWPLAHEGQITAKYWV